MLNGSLKKLHNNRINTQILVRTKVLLVGPLPPPFGGIPTYVKSLSEAFIQDIDLICFNTALPENIAPFNREGKSSYSSMFENGFLGGIKKILFALLSYIRLFVTISQEKPDIVQVFTCSYWGYWRNWLYILTARLLRKKTIFHLLNAIDLFYINSDKFGKFLLTKSLNSADIYLVQSPGLQEWLNRYCHKKTFGIWNGIDLSSIPSCPIFIEKNKFSGTLVGITVGGLSKNKGTYDILDVLHAFKDQGVIINWIFVGNGNLEYFRKLVKEKGLENQIEFTGPVTEELKWQKLYSADFYCMPSYAEGQPISIIEAMAIGLPIISSDVGSIREMIGYTECGIVVRPGCVDELKKALLDIIQDEEKRISMGIKAKEVAYSRHKDVDLFTSLEQIYKSIV